MQEVKLQPAAAWCYKEGRGGNSGCISRRQGEVWMGIKDLEGWIRWRRHKTLIARHLFSYLLLFTISAANKKTEWEELLRSLVSQKSFHDKQNPQRSIQIFTWKLWIISYLTATFQISPSFICLWNLQGVSVACPLTNLWPLWHQWSKAWQAAEHIKQEEDENLVFKISVNQGRGAIKAALKYT